MRIDSATAMAIPGSTPSRTTLPNATIDTRNSALRCRHSRAVPGISASDSDAVITTAASAGCGRFRNKPGTSTIITMITTAPTTPVSWVLAPDRSATAVRDPLVLTGNPWNKPAARFATPIPVISPLPSISCPVRAANADAVEIVSASDTRAIPSAPPSSGARSAAWMSGMVSGGNPLGSTPTRLTPWLARLKTVVETIASTTMISTAGIFGSHRCSTSISTSPAIPTAAAAGTAFPWARPSANPVTSPRKPSASTLNPNSLGSCPTRMVRARPFIYPIIVGLEIRSAMKPSLATAPRTRIPPTISASIDASAMARSGLPSAPASGRIVAAIIGPSEESGPSTRIRDGPNTA